MKRILVDWGITIESQKPLVYLSTGAAKYCGREIELNLPVTHEQARLIINLIVSRCKRQNEPLKQRGKMDVYSIPVMFIDSWPVRNIADGVWRIVLPDENGKYPDEKGCNPLFQGQLHSLNPVN